MANKKDSKDNLVITSDMLQAALEQNPQMLADLLNKVTSGAQKNTKSFKVLGSTEKEVMVKKMSGTRIVDDRPVKELHYMIQLQNGATVSLPAHCLKDYKINLNNPITVDKDGLSLEEQNLIKERGAF